MNNKHVLYTNEDRWIPASILDLNGDVQLHMCKICGKAECELDEPCKSTTELALAWFNSKSSLEKTRLCDTNTEIVGHTRRYETLTDSEIEKIWRQELQEESAKFEYQIFDDGSNYKQNTKQFKEFSPELFKAYIDKFSDEDKLKACQVLYNSLPNLLKTQFCLREVI